MEDPQLLIDLHKAGERQGPGGEPETRMAMKLAALDRSRPLKVIDIGCGTGASTLVLAKELNARITAVDFLPDFLDILRARARQQGVGERITPLACSMDELSFPDAESDVIWSEGAIYNIGFEAGITQWTRFLKPGGILAISEMTWFIAARPAELQAYWEKEYPEIDTASAKTAVLERHGFSLLAYFVLPAHCWLDNYYRPLENRFDSFLQRHGQSQQARATVEAEKKEIALYNRYHQYYGYGFYIARKAEP